MDSYQQAATIIAGQLIDDCQVAYHRELYDPETGMKAQRIVIEIDNIPQIFVDEELQDELVYRTQILLAEMEEDN